MAHILEELAEWMTLDNRYFTFGGGWGEVWCGGGGGGLGREWSVVNQQNDRNVPKDEKIHRDDVDRKYLIICSVIASRNNVYIL